MDTLYPSPHPPPTAPPPAPQIPSLNFKIDIKMLHHVLARQWMNNSGLRCCPKVAELVTSEFFEQGDRERSELKLTPAVS